MKKIKLKIKSDTIFVEDDEWNRFVFKIYNRPYNIQQQEGFREPGVIYFSVPDVSDDDQDMHDSIPEEINGVEMGVKFSTWLNRDPQKLLEDCEFTTRLFWYRNFYPDLQTIANDLFVKRLLKKGNYGIIIE